MKQLRNHLTILIILLITIFTVGLVQAGSTIQDSKPEQKAKAMLDNLTPEERVGQLFLITFDGINVEEKSQIYDLIVNHHIGGVVLRAENNNFIGPENTITEAFEMIASLQSNEWDGSKKSIQDPNSGDLFKPQYIPLFIGISQEGDGYPYDQIINRVSPLPNLMAIGATWNPELAEQVGSVLGKEMHGIGVNIIFGPSLDVLDILQAEGGKDLGTRTFGGDPYWVGEMGKAYIQGIHQGSSNQVAVITKHFPGRGGSDRLPDEEVATVRKSLEQLKQIELEPFFAVTGNSPTPESTTDGLLVSHIRYQGFQGNIRATTRPVSFDSAALETLMELPPFATWRQNGGVVVSDDLASRAVKRFYDPVGLTFDARRVARDAFLAGNDLLYVDNFIGTGEEDKYSTILHTLEFFAKKYSEDPAFSQRVDISVERLLNLKYQIYENFSLEDVLPSKENIAEIGQSHEVTFEIAQKAATLISPGPGELNDALSGPPETSDRIVFITDVVTGSQCDQCFEQIVLSADALQNAVIKLYGPQAGSLVFQYNLSSYSFNDLMGLLDDAPDLPPLEEEIRQADWIVFAILNVQSDRSESYALRRFLSERPDLFRNKRVVAFSFNAPYYLDATEISKLTAYYALYSKIPAFVDVAARILFQEVTPTGALPVSVPGVGYDLISITSPDPTQVIPLFLDLPEAPLTQATITETTATLEPTQVPMFTVGDTIPLLTGLIYDHNRNPVPDGTVARFLFSTGGETGTTQQIETVTKQGVAQATYQIKAPGLLEIRIASDPAVNSEVLQLDVLQGGSIVVTEVSPTIDITNSPEPTIKVKTVTTSVEATSVPDQPSDTATGIWLISISVIWGSAAGIFWVTRQWISLRWGVRWGLLSALGGLLAYIYQTISLPGSKQWLELTGAGGLIALTILGVLLGFGVGWLWWWIKRRRLL